MIIYDPIPFLVLCSLLFMVVVVAQDALLHQKFGTVTAGAYDRYEIKNIDGKIRLELDSLSGDCDLYVSLTNLSPTFTEYDYQSNTCGIDSVEFQCTYGQSVGVSVFGYSTHNESSYRLTVWQVHDYNKELTFDELDRIFNTFDEDFDEDVSHSAETTVNRKKKYDGDGETNSLSDTLWTIMITFLKIMLDILV